MAPFLANATAHQNAKKLKWLFFLTNVNELMKYWRQCLKSSAFSKISGNVVDIYLLCMIHCILYASHHTPTLHQMDRSELYIASAFWKIPLHSFCIFIFMLIFPVVSEFHWITIIWSNTVQLIQNGWMISNLGKKGEGL